MRIVAIEGHRCLILCRAAWRLSELNALLASTNKMASVDSFENVSLAAWTAASVPSTHLYNNVLVSAYIRTTSHYVKVCITVNN